MCRELVARAVADERMLKVCAFPTLLDLIAASWKRGDPSLYGRFDLSLRRARGRRSCSNTMPTRRPRYSRPACSSGLAGGRDRRRSPEGCRSVQLAARAADRRLEGDRPRAATCISPARPTIRRTAARSTTWRTPRVRPASPPRVLPVEVSAAPEGRVRRRRQADRACSSSIRGSGCSASSSAPSWPARRRVRSSRRGRRSSPTRAYCRCCGPCSRATRTCCRPISRTIRRPPSLATRSCASRSIRARAPTSRSSSTAQRSIRSRDRMARKALSGRRSRPCRTLQENYAAIGSWIAAGKPCGLSVREDFSPITKNTSRFLPHAIVG